jgi:hypothetical protein
MKASSAAWAETIGNPTIAAEANRLPPIKRNLDILFPPCEMLASPRLARPVVPAPLSTANPDRR